MVYSKLELCVENKGKMMTQNVMVGGIIGVVVVLLAIMLNVESKETESALQPKPMITLGASLPLSGPMAYIGQSSQNTLKLALEEWKKRGSRYNYELLIEDDAFEPKKVNRNVNRLVNLKKANAVLTVLTPAATEANTITNDKKVIHLGCAYGKGEEEGLYSFNNMTPNESMAALMLQNLKDKEIKTLAVLVSTDSNSRQQTKVLEDLIKKDGTIKITSKKVYPAGTQKFEKILRSMLKSEKPDLFYVNGVTPEASLVAKDLKKVSGEVKLTTINDFIEDKNRGAFNGLWFVSSGGATDEFSEKYAEQFGLPLYLCAPNSYDSLNLLIWAYEHTPKRKGESVPVNEDVVKTILDIKDWHGALGISTVTPDGRLISKPSLSEISNGRVKKLSSL